jgi:hypothetical protein
VRPGTAAIGRIAVRAPRPGAGLKAWLGASVSAADAATGPRSGGDRVKSRCRLAYSYKAQTPAFHRAHRRTARRVWRMVVRATHTPSTLVLPGPHPTATCVTMSSGGASGAGVMPCAEVAIVRAKPAIAINLSIVVLLRVVKFLILFFANCLRLAPGTAASTPMSLRFGRVRLDTDQARRWRHDPRTVVAIDLGWQTATRFIQGICPLGQWPSGQ